MRLRPRRRRATSSRYRLGKMGFGPGELGSVDAEYGLKEARGSSHSRILELLDEPAAVAGARRRLLERPARRAGPRARPPRDRRRPSRPPGTVDRVDAFVEADLEDGLPAEVGTGFDVVDRRRRARARPPARTSCSARSPECSGPGGRLIVVGAELRPLVPAAAHRWSGRSTTTSAASSTGPTALLHPQEPGPDGAAGRLRDPSPPRGRPAVRRAVRRRRLGAAPGCCAASTRWRCRCARRCSPTSSCGTCSARAPRRC